MTRALVYVATIGAGLALAAGAWLGFLSVLSWMVSW